jgi:hypothetical protein
MTWWHIHSKGTGIGKGVVLLFALSACVDPFAASRSSRAPTGILSSAGEREEQARASVERSRERSGVSYTTITEIVRQPALFVGQWVRLKGRVVGVSYHSSRRKKLIYYF